MQDAVLLSLTDANGAPLWHPASLRDIDRHGSRVLDLWLAIRDGMTSRAEPWVWWRIRGTPTAHHFPATPMGRPGTARCGVVAGDEDWTRDVGDARCRVCSAKAEGSAAKPGMPFGSIGGKDVTGGLTT